MINTASSGHWLIIFNPAAGLKEKANLLNIIEGKWPHIRKTFIESRPQDLKIPESGYFDPSLYDLIIVAGGDGTIHQVAQYLIDTGKPLGIIPAGSGNGLATWLGLPRNTSKALDVIEQGSIQSIDVGIVNGQPFFNLSGLGIDGCIAAATHRMPNKGFWPYLKKGIQIGLGYPGWQGTIQIPDSKNLEDTFYSVVVANGPTFGYGFRLIPSADVRDGLLDVCIILKRPVWVYLPALFLMAIGIHRKFDWLIHTRSPSVTITPHGNVPGHLDGEALLCAGRLNFGILTRKLNVIFPNNEQKKA